MEPEITSNDFVKLSLHEYNKKYVTVIHPRVRKCNHRLDLGRQPRHRNCETCWFAWFNNHGEIVQQCDEMFAGDGGHLLSELQGDKFVARFLGFMATIAKFKKEAEQMQENNG